MYIADEIAKLQQRLGLLREEYVKLQKHCEDVEKERAQLRATSEAQNGTGFVAQILKAISLMFKKSDYRYVCFPFASNLEFLKYCNTAVKESFQRKFLGKA